MKFFNLSHFCSSGNHIAGTLGPSLFSECSTCLGTSRATESERLLMSAQKHKAGQWIWCRSTKEMCAGVTQWGSWDVPLAASTRRPRGQQKRARLHSRQQGYASALALHLQLQPHSVKQKPLGMQKHFEVNMLAKCYKCCKSLWPPWPAAGPKSRWSWSWSWS